VLFLLSVVMLNAVMFSGVMLHIVYAQWNVVYLECHYAGCLYLSDAMISVVYAACC
jgi:hypothetical protein